MSNPEPKAGISSFNAVAGALVAFLINAGMMYQQFQTVRDEQKANAVMVGIIKENQINNLADVRYIKRELESLHHRIVMIERNYPDRSDKRR